LKNTSRITNNTIAATKNGDYISNNSADLGQWRSNQNILSTTNAYTVFRDWQCVDLIVNMLVASVCSYGGLQGAGNRDYCAVPHRVSPSGIRAGLAGGLLVGVGSVFTLDIGR